MTRVSSVITGAAGEHFAMAELLRRGLVAAKAPEGVPNFDIVITDIAGERWLMFASEAMNAGLNCPVLMVKSGGKLK